MVFHFFEFFIFLIAKKNYASNRKEAKPSQLASHSRCIPRYPRVRYVLLNNERMLGRFILVYKFTALAIAAHLWLSHTQTLS